VAAGRSEGEDPLKRQIGLLNTILKNDPGNAQAVKMLALTYGAVNDFGKTADIFRDMRDKSTVADATFQSVEGIALALGKDAVGGEEALRQTCANAPDDGDAAAALGLVMNIQGQSDAAAESLEKALTLKTSVDGKVRLQLGLIYLQKGQAEKALKEFTDARAEIKDDARLQFYHALALQETGLKDEALVEFERVSTAGGQFGGPAALQMATIYLKNQLPDKAMGSIRRAIELGVSSARLFTVQGQIQAAQASMPDAEQSYRRAIQMDKDYPAAHLELGLMQISRNASEDGLRELERYLELTAQSPEGTHRNEVELLVNQLKQTLKAS
jgi:Tfp pilus assembly protein PilF